MAAAPRGFGMLRLHLVVKTTPSVDVRKGGATMNWRRFVCAFAASAAAFACVGDVSAATHEAGRLIDPSIDIGLNAPRPCSTLLFPDQGQSTSCPQLAR